VDASLYLQVDIKGKSFAKPESVAAHEEQIQGMGIKQYHLKLQSDHLHGFEDRGGLMDH
jgi:hypothetical protein